MGDTFGLQDTKTLNMPKKSLGGVSIQQNRRNPVISAQSTPVDTGPLGGINLMDAVRAAAMAKGTPSVAASPNAVAPVMSPVVPVTPPGVPTTTMAGTTTAVGNMQVAPLAVSGVPNIPATTLTSTQVPTVFDAEKRVTASPEQTIMGLTQPQFTAMAGLIGGALAPQEYGPLGQAVPSRMGNFANLAGQFGLAQMLAEQKSNARTGGK